MGRPFALWIGVVFHLWAQAPDLVGGWRWSCCEGQHTGVWYITGQRPDGSFSGKFSERTPEDIGSIEGRLSGSRVEFIRSGVADGRPFEQHWAGTLEGDRITGTLEHGTFRAERLPPELIGLWKWTCCGGAHSGRWEITRQEPGGAFWGRFLETRPDDIGAIEGNVRGNRVEFRRSGTAGGQPFEQRWAGLLSGGKLTGRLEFGEFTAERIESAAGPQELPPGGICFDPQTLAFMDEWLAQARPPQQPGESLRYDPWGRIVGAGRSGELTAPPRPQTRLGRCDWLWYHSANLRSVNLGTLREYVDKRRNGAAGAARQ